MNLSNTLAYRQAKATASLSARAGFINSVEPFKDERYVFCRYANPGIHDGDDSHLSLAANRYGNSPWSGRISDGIPSIWNRILGLSNKQRLHGGPLTRFRRLGGNKSLPREHPLDSCGLVGAYTPHALDRRVGQDYICIGRHEADSGYSAVL